MSRARCTAARSTRSSIRPIAGWLRRWASLTPGSQTSFWWQTFRRRLLSASGRRWRSSTATQKASLAALETDRKACAARAGKASRAGERPKAATAVVSALIVRAYVQRRRPRRAAHQPLEVGPRQASGALVQQGIGLGRAVDEDFLRSIREGANAFQPSAFTSQSSTASRIASRRLVKRPERPGWRLSATASHSSSIATVHFAEKRPATARLTSASAVAIGNSTHASSTAVKRAWPATSVVQAQFSRVVGHPLQRIRLASMHPLAIGHQVFSGHAPV
jgi:hypothetical protein